MNLVHSSVCSWLQHELGQLGLQLVLFLLLEEVIILQSRLRTPYTFSLLDLIF